MRPSARFVVGLALFSATLVQLSAIDRLHLPGGRPNLVLIIVVAVGLLAGPLSGSVAGFAAGLAGDLLGAHALGRLALLWTLVGYLAGLLSRDEDRSPLVPLAVITAASVVATLGYAALGALLGDPHTSAVRVVRQALATGVYNLLLTPFLYAPLRGLLVRLDPQRR